jgi:hypothetical protein
MLNDIDIDFDIAEATETILPYVATDQAEIFSDLETASATGFIQPKSVPSVPSSEAAGNQHGPRSFESSAGSSPTDASFAMVGLGVEEPLPPQEVQDEL